jgi:hypothetical protein
MFWLQLAKDLSHVQLRCTGTRYDPKNVTILRGVAGITDVITEHLNLSREAAQTWFHDFCKQVKQVMISSLLRVPNFPASRGFWEALKVACNHMQPNHCDQ